MAEEGLWESQTLGFYDNSCSGTVNTVDNLRPITRDDVPPPSPPPPPQPAQAAAQAGPSKKRGREGDGCGVNKSKKAKKGGSSEEGNDEKHDIHILTERERRKKMRDMFINLRGLIPNLSTKADKSTIVDEAVAYIKSLESTVDGLEKKKQERQQLGIPYKTREAFLADQTSTSINDIVVNPSSANSSLNSSPNALPNGLFPVGFQVWTSPNVVLTICGDEAQFTVCSAKKFGTLSFILFVLEKYNIEVLTATVSSDANRNIFMIQTHARGAGQLGELMELFSVEDIYKKAADEITQWTSAA